MNANSLETISNRYTEMQAEAMVKKHVLLEKAKNAAKRAQETASQLVKIGDDSKVDEAVLISWLCALYDNVTKAFNQWQALGYDKRVLKLEKEHQSMQEKLDRLAEFQGHRERILRYTALNVEKNALEQKVLEHKEKTGIGIDDVVEITDAPSELYKLETRLVQVNEEMQEIATFYEHEDQTEFMAQMETAEQKWYSQSGSAYLQDIRNKPSGAVGNSGDNTKIHEHTVAAAKAGSIEILNELFQATEPQRKSTSPSQMAEVS